MSVGARSLYEQCLETAIKFIDQVQDFGDTPHAIVQILISHVKTAEHLAQLEENNPEISYLTCHKWWDFIKRDCPRWEFYLIDEPIEHGEKVRGGEKALKEKADCETYNVVVKRYVEEQQIAQKHLERQTAILQAKKIALAPKVQTGEEARRRQLLAERTRRNMGKVHQMVSVDIDRRSERGRWMVYRDDRFLTSSERQELLRMPTDVTKMTLLHKKVADEILKKRSERVERYNRSIGLIEPKSAMKSKKIIDKATSPIAAPVRSQTSESLQGGLITSTANKPKIRTIKVTVPTKGKGAQSNKELRAEEPSIWDDMPDFAKGLIEDDMKAYSTKSKSRDSTESKDNVRFSRSGQANPADWSPRPIKRKRAEERSGSESSKKAKN